MKILVLGGTGAMGQPLVEILGRGSVAANVTVTSRSPHKSHGIVNYVMGNARDNRFVEELLGNGYDAVIDFMNYDLDEFAARIPMLLESTNHYIWFSSCRVYAESDKPLTESSPRLLETSKDKDFLATNRYALRKARQEDLLKASGYGNYTIVRPYITYNDERLQLGILEKEQWLFRILKGKPLVVSKTMLDKVTTLTHGDDVAAAVVKLIGKKEALGDTVQIAGNDTIRWIDLLKEVYLPVIWEFTPPINRGCIYSSNYIGAIEMLYEGGYNTIYDRNYNRSFDSAKINKLVGDISYTTIKVGVKKCLTNFLSGERVFRHIDPIYEAYQDILTDSKSSVEDFDNEDDFNRYRLYRAKSVAEIDGLDDIKELIQ